jgi:predicted nucleic acid-binding protein
VRNGYLLDNNVISVLARPTDPRYSIASAHLDRIGESPIFVPVIAIAEIEFGMLKAEAPDLEQQASLRQYLASFSTPLAVDRNTIEPYALIRAELWREHGTRKARGHKEKLPEELLDRVTGKELGIDERDLLIASVAVQYNLILATMDRNSGMLAIEAAAQRVANAGKPFNLRVEDWSKSV